MADDVHAPLRRHRRGGARSLPAPARLALTITPMIDVVFLLLVYFLLTSGLGVEERLLRTEPAASAPDAPTTGAFELEDEPIVVRVATGPGGRPSIRLSGGLAQPRDAAELSRILRDALISTDTPGGLFAAEHPVRIAPEPELPWQDVVAVFDAVRGAGYRMVAFGGGR